MNKYFMAFLTFFVMFNGLVWNKLFNEYREYYMETIDSLEDDRVRLQLRIDELENGYKLDGLDVTVTMYHPVRHQTDGTPNILADGTQNMHVAHVAVLASCITKWCPNMTRCCPNEALYKTSVRLQVQQHARAFQHLPGTTAQRARWLPKNPRC